MADRDREAEAKEELLYKLGMVQTNAEAALGELRNIIQEVRMGYWKIGFTAAVRKPEK